ncbi:MAG: class II histone deacetylase [Pseudomonadota bacterium]
MWHTTGPSTGIFVAHGQLQPGVHVENPETKRRLKNLLDGYGVTDDLDVLGAAAVDDEVLLRFHTPDYLERLATLSRASGGQAGDSAPFGAGSYELARRAVGCCLSGAHAVVDGQVDNAYVLTRPPGHHAERDRGRGFCLLANLSLAVLDLLALGKVERVAIVDWDVHHGNGTQQAFYADPRVLTLSIHQDQLYPAESGFLSETGEGSGLGRNMNVPLPPGSGAAAYSDVFDRVVEPAFRDFEPDLIVIACGFDSSYFDPMGHMLLLSPHYAAMTERLCALADALGHGRVLCCHEGGYSESYVPFCGVATIDALRGQRSTLRDRFAEGDEYSWQALQPHQRSAVDAAVSGPLQAFVDAAAG